MRSVLQPGVTTLQLKSSFHAVLQVCAGNVAWLLDMASYLEVQPLQEACCEVRTLHTSTFGFCIVDVCQHGLVFMLALS